MIRMLIKLLFLVYFVSVESFAGEGPIGVIFPDMREPYQSIFSAIIEGILEVQGDRVLTISVKKEVDPEHVVDWVNENNIKYLIALGNRGQSMVENINFDVEKVVVGAVLRPPLLNGDSLFDGGVMLMPSPKLVYEQLGSLVPEVKKIYLVYSAANKWYVDIAIERAVEEQYELVALKSGALKESLTIYNDLLEDIESNCAIWLLQDSLSSDVRLILPRVLAASWEKRIPVISNNAGLVKRGVLFALYPDHFELGVEIASNLEIPPTSKQKFMPFRAANSAANTRTANHLNLGWSRRTIREFDLVFPSE